jgi:hypothetical protein
VWHEADLSAITGAPALFPLAAYEQGGAQHVIATAQADGHLWELRFTPATGWYAYDVTRAAHIETLPDVRPAAIGRGGDYGQAIVYAGTDHNLYLLSSGTTGWTEQRISDTADSTAARPTGGLNLYQSDLGDRLVVTYTSTVYQSNHLREVAWTPATGWRAADLTTLTGFPQVGAIGRSSGYFFDADPSDRLFTVDPSGAINELVHTRDERRFLWRDTGNDATTRAGQLNAFTAPDNAAGSSYTGYVSYLSTDGHLHVMDYSAPWEA